MLSRRFILSGLASSLSSPLWANAPSRSIRPAARPVHWGRQAVPSADEIIASAAISGKVAFALVDAKTGRMLESRNPLLAQPPASVTKAITALYGLRTLGPQFQFRTQLVATGPVQNGRLNEDLVLVGSGDPQMDTDTLVKLAKALKTAGVREVTGRFRVAPGALPYIAAIDPGQPDHVGYNPSVSGLNLNFNRVYFEWKRQASDYAVTMDARSDSVRPQVSVARMSIADRDLPVYTYAERRGVERWTVARTALGNGGGRWLPVRHPEAYVSEVFQILARAHGIVLRSGDPVSGSVQGQVLAEERSAELRPLLRSMLRFSTNLTAEAVGMTATIANRGRPGSLAASAQAMNSWVEGNLGLSSPRFVDHSGLGDGSRISPRDMVTALMTQTARSELQGILKPIHLEDGQGTALGANGPTIVAKTGTLNFVSGLAGYIRTPKGRDLVFAMFSADMSRRTRIARSERERPQGGRRWTRAARRMQHDLLRRWSEIYDE